MLVGINPYKKIFLSGRVCPSYKQEKLNPATGRQSFPTLKFP